MTLTLFATDDTCQWGESDALIQANTSCYLLVAGITCIATAAAVAASAVLTGLITTTTLCLPAIICAAALLAAGSLLICASNIEQTESEAKELVGAQDKQGATAPTPGNVCPDAGDL